MKNTIIEKNLLIHKTKHNIRRFTTTSKWLFLAVLIGIVVGVIGGSFGYLLQYVTTLRLSHPQLLLLLPFGAILIVAMYRLVLHTKDPGTNLVLSAIHSIFRCVWLL